MVRATGFDVKTKWKNKTTEESDRRAIAAAVAGGDPVDVASCEAWAEELGGRLGRGHKTDPDRRRHSPGYCRTVVAGICFL
jgi:hypothetical protein